MSSTASSASNFMFGTSRKFWIILALLIWLGFVIAHIPAIWAAYAMTRNGQLALSGVSGSVWSGRASLASVKIKNQDYSLGQLSWKLELSSLVLLKPCAQVSAQLDNQNFNGRVCLGRKGAVSITDGDGSFPSSLIQPLLPLAIDGQFAVHVSQLNLQNNQLQKLVNGKISWTGAKVYNGSNWMDLGGFGADLADDGKFGLSGHLFDINSPIHMDLVVSLLYPSGGSLHGGLMLNKKFLEDSNASGWLAMFATKGNEDAQGNVPYSVNMNL